MLLRAAVIIDGGYTTGYINSLGDGGNGAQASLLAGKFLNDWFALFGEFAYRTRNNNIPGACIGMARLTTLAW